MIERMLEFFEGSTAEIVYLSICLFGAIVSGFSLLLGGHGHGDHGEVGGDHGGDGYEHGLGLFSVRGMSLLATGFGGIAYLVQNYTGKVLLSSVSGLLFGLLFAIAGLAMVRVFFRQQATSLITPSQISGATGMVTTSIPAEGYGEVLLTAAGQQIAKRASTEGSNTIPNGTPVRVVRYLGGVLVVEKLSSDKGDEE